MLGGKEELASLRVTTGDPAIPVCDTAIRSNEVEAGGGKMQESALSS